MKNITINALAILFLLASCDSVSTDKIGKVKSEEKLVKEYCKTSSDKNFFRASATIKHPDLGESEYEAVQFAKAQMAENISQQIKSVTDRYKKTRTINGVVEFDKSVGGITRYRTEVDLSEVMVQVDKGHNPKIELTDEMGLIMRYPTIDSFVENNISEITASNMVDVIASCILQIYDKKGEEVFDAKDQTKKELTEFVEQLNTKQFEEVQKFFDTMPKLKHTIEVENPKTKVKSKIELQGLNDFFE